MILKHMKMLSISFNIYTMKIKLRNIRSFYSRFASRMNMLDRVHPNPFFLLFNNHITCQACSQN